MGVLFTTKQDIEKIAIFAATTAAKKGVDYVRPMIKEQIDSTTSSRRLQVLGVVVAGGVVAYLYKSYSAKQETKDAATGDLSQRRYMNNKWTVFDDLLKEEQQTTYIHREEELKVIEKFESEIFTSNDTFGLVIYGGKRVGKTSLIKHVLMYYSPSFNPMIKVSRNKSIETNAYYPPSQVENDWISKLKSHYQSKPPFTIKTFYIDINFKKDIDTQIRNELVQSGAVSYSLKELLASQIGYDQRVLLYFHIKQMERNAFKTLIGTARGLVGQRRGIGAIFEVSKSWIFATGEFARCKKIKIGLLSQSMEQEFLNILKPNIIGNEDENEEKQQKIEFKCLGHIGTIRQFVDEKIFEDLTALQQILKDREFTTKQLRSVFSDEASIYTLMKPRHDDDRKLWEELVELTFLEYNENVKKYYVENPLVVKAVNDYLAGNK